MFTRAGAGAGRAQRSVRRPWRPALPCPPCPAQILPLPAATSALLYPLTLRLSLCSSLSLMDTFASQSHVPGARRSEQINYFQLQARAGGGGPRPSRTGAASRPPGICEGMALGPLRSFLNAKECRKLPDQLVNQ